MNATSRISLYDLLPAIYRIDDEKAGGPLRAFLSVVQEQVDAVQDDVSRLYADLFIETCEECLIPYIGDLVGNRPMNDVIRTRRADVARTLYYRRRKGTLPALEELARDVTGWSVRAVPFFELMVWTQNLNHLRDAGKTAAIRDLRTLDLLHGAFERTAHTVDVRAMTRRTGHYHPKRVGFFLWRLTHHHVDGSVARQQSAPDTHGYHFAPAGVFPADAPAPLFQRPVDLDSGDLAEERHVRQAIRRLAFFDNAAAFADTTVIPSIHSGNGVSFGPALKVTPMDLSVFAQPAAGIVGFDSRTGRISFAAGEIPTQVGVSYRNQEIELAEPLPNPNSHVFRFPLLNLTIEHDLAQVPIAAYRYMDLSTWAQPPAGEVGVDLGLGRLSFAVGEEPNTDVVYHFGKDAPKIARQAQAPHAHGFLLDLPVNLGSIRIAAIGSPVPPAQWFCMKLNNWQRPPALHVGVDVERGRLTFAAGEEPTGAVILSYDRGFPGDSGGGPYDRTAPSRAGEKVTTAAAQSLRAESAFPQDPAALELRVGLGDHVTIDDALDVWRAAGRPNARVRIQDNRTYTENLLLDLADKSLILEAAPGTRPVIAGSVTTTGGAAKSALLLSGLWVRDAFFAQGSLDKLTISHCTMQPGVTGAIDATPGLNPSLTVDIERSVLGGVILPADSSLEVRDSILQSVVTNGVCSLDGVTVLGGVSAHEIGLISECIVTGAVNAVRRQTGCIRYSFVPSLSVTPRRFRCQPDLALEGVPVAQQAAAEVKVTPVFSSQQPGAPGYAQLAQSCPQAITTGGEDGAEMGAYRFLEQGRREANLRLRLDEYLPFGLRAGLFYMN